MLGDDLATGMMIGSWNRGGRARAGAAVHNSGHPSTSAVAVIGENRSSPINTSSHHTRKGGTPSGEGGTTRLSVGNLQWWTTDSELEAALSEFGRVKNLKFDEERVSGKSKGYCQVEFHEPASARACREGMDGRVFNGMPCVVAFSSLQSLRQTAAAHAGTIQSQQPPNPPPQAHGKRQMGDGGGMRGVGLASQSGSVGIGGKGQGPGSSGRTGHGNSGRGRGRRGGGGGVRVPLHGQANPRSLDEHRVPLHDMDSGSDYHIGSGGTNFGEFVPRGPSYVGLGLSYSTLTPRVLPGFAPRVNSAFFGSSPTMNGIGSIGGIGMEGTRGLDGEEHDQRIREYSSYWEGSVDVDHSCGGDIDHGKGRAEIGRDRLSMLDGEWRPSGDHQYKHRERIIGAREDMANVGYERDGHLRARNESRGWAEQKMFPSLDEYSEKRQWMFSDRKT